MSVPTPTFSGIPYPATTGERRNSMVGPVSLLASQAQHSQSAIQPTIAFGEPDRVGSINLGGQRDRSDSIRSVDFHDTLPAKRLGVDMDMQFQRLKIYDQRWDIYLLY